MCDFHHETSQKFQVSRRNLLKAGVAASVTPFGMTGAFSAFANNAPNAITPADALARLMEGNGRYVANMPEQQDFSANRPNLVKAQFPIASILSCSDSRVVPDMAFDQDPGDLFIMRVAGNVMSPNLLASLEYGVKFLGTPLVIVMGHTSCGAVGAAIDVLQNEADLPGHLPELISAIEPAVIKAKAEKSGDLLNNSIVQNVREQVAKLKISAPIVNKFYNDKKIDIVGAVYDLKDGRVSLV
ncbi:carbonic anhydrase [Sneathiella marina]|uniref:carbonic anhydrase n=1 Tax=Sneathiella marina TaxID=2950108 RepID=A0ABY4WBB9_9PROT|nr:carbonic anhydrase [Sneathiella marina]USG61961.1 carbonic anhydrase [Sneathiella marina]